MNQKDPYEQVMRDITEVMRDVIEDTGGLQKTVKEANITAQQLKAAAMLYIYYKHPDTAYSANPMAELETMHEEINYLTNFITFLRDRKLIEDGGNW